MNCPTDKPRCAPFPPAVLRPAELTVFGRGGGARTTPLATRAVGAEHDKAVETRD